MLNKAKSPPANAVAPDKGPEAWRELRPCLLSDSIPSELRLRQAAIPMIQSISHPKLRFLAAKRTHDPDLATFLQSAFAP